MRGWDFQNDGVSLHRAKETREALNEVCVTVSGADLHSAANRSDLNPIEQRGGRGRRSINREECNTSEKFSVQAQAALNAISMESVNGMVENYSTCLCAVLVLRGQCLNVHRSVMRDLHLGVLTPDEIAHAREAQTESLQRFVEGSRRSFTALSSGDRPQGYRR
jgi:hypothetical protein